MINENLIRCCNLFIRLAKLENLPLTPLKLGSLLYLTYAFQLVFTDERLFEDKFEAWDYGPVIPAVYHYFKSYGRSTINKYAILMDSPEQLVTNSDIKGAGYQTTTKHQSTNHFTKDYLETVQAGKVNLDDFKKNTYQNRRGALRDNIKSKPVYISCLSLPAESLLIILKVWDLYKNIAATDILTDLCLCEHSAWQKVYEANLNRCLNDEDIIAEFKTRLDLNALNAVI